MARPARHKIVLYNPMAVFHTMPLGLLAVGSNLDPERYDVRIVDARLSPDAHAEVLREIDDALCFGVTMLTGRPIADALKLLRAVKQRRPGLTTVAGGWHPSLFRSETLSEPAIDITVAGQGEATFAELVERLAQGGDPACIAGLAYRGPTGVVVSPPRALAAMDNYPPPNFDLIPVERYFSLKGRRQFDYIASIGCNYRCAFCADPFVYGRNWKGMSPRALGEDIEKLWRRYAFTDLNFQDETYFTHQHRVAAICEEFLRRGLKFTWAGTLRADQGVRLSEETWRLCVDSGLRRVLVGVETGSPEMMKRILKDTTVDAVLETAAKCRRHGIHIIFSFIVGFPGETRDQLEDTLALIKTLRAMSPHFETPIFYYKPYPGSALADNVQDQVPRTLDEWANFDYVQGAAGNWVSPEVYRRVERFKFYNSMAWGPETRARRPLQRIARWRARNDCYAFPVEKFLVETLRPAERLS
jgi:anaerobic magnesium-protoporphyrin IX monomethyl ester cyclase